MTLVDGEFRLIGRVGNETGAISADFGSTPDQAVAIFAGGPIETQYIDGLKISVLSTQNMTMNVDLITPIDSTMVPQGTRSLCKVFSWLTDYNTHSNQMPLDTRSTRQWD
jgi:hypothetical protein